MVIIREKERFEKGQLSGQASDRIGGRGLPVDPELLQRKIKRLGYAVDIGTTTVAMAGFLFFEEDAEPVCLGRRTEPNAQGSLGKDVMMRIMHAVSGKQEELQRMIVLQIERMAEELLMPLLGEKERKTGESEGKMGIGIMEARILDSENLETTITENVEFVIVGNTAMSHLFLGESVEGLAGAPFRSAYQGNRTVRGSEIGFCRFAAAEVFVLSGIAAHVGGDALAVLCETGMQREDEISLAIDLGTNAEILLNDHGRLSCCSAAAGPAFEGRGVASGRTAGAGVITGVRFAGHTGNLILEYIPGRELCGICGSGLIDLLAELLRMGLMTADGYLLSEEEAGQTDALRPFASRMRTDERGERCFLIYGTEDDLRAQGRRGHQEGKAAGRDILLTQKDIRNLQLAKGAIAAATKVLLKEHGIVPGELDRLILSGVLGSSIHPGRAVGLGLIPGVEKERIELAGNAALDGAVTLLMKPESRETWEGMAERVEHVELVEKEGFGETFMEKMRFGEI